MPDWKKTALGTPIELYSSHSLAVMSSLSPILLIGGVHGDEPEGVHLAKKALGALMQWNLTESLVPWIVIPILNPDGFAKRTRVNSRGVDLNRNYPSTGWTSAMAPGQERYCPGPSPASEPEVQGVVELFDSIQLRLVIHCHSWKPCIVATGPNAQRDGAKLAKASGYELVPEIGYPTPGSLSQFGWHDRKVPVICIEEQDHLSDFDSIWPRFSEGLKSVFTDTEPRTVTQE